MAHPGGRPTEYNPEFCDKVDEYLDSCKDIYEKGKLKEVNFPTVDSFSLMLGVSKATLYNWAKKYKKFFYALEKIGKYQQKKLLESGLSGDYNSNIAKLVLSANHGMKERSDVTSKDKELPTPIYGGKSNNNQE